MMALEYAGETVDLVDHLGQQVCRALLARAALRARQEGRELVTEADVLAGLKDALNEVVTEELGLTHGD